MDVSQNWTFTFNFKQDKNPSLLGENPASVWPIHHSNPPLDIYKSPDISFSVTFTSKTAINDMRKEKNALC